MNTLYPLGLDKKPVWKKKRFFFFLLVVSPLVAIGVAPSVLSTKTGTAYLSKMLSQKLHGKVQLQSVSLSWFSGQEIEGISYSEDSAILFASCERITTTSTLFTLISKKELGDLAVTSPHVKIKRDLATYRELQAPQMQVASLVYIPAFTPSIQKALFPCSGKVLINGGAIDLIASGIDPVYIQNINSTLLLTKDKSAISLNLTASSLQENKPGEISLESSLQNINTDSPKISIESSITNLPVKVLDQIVSLARPELKGELIDLLGSSLSLNVNGSLAKSQAHLQLDAKSENLQASIATVSSGDEITLKEAAKISLTLSENLRNKYFPSLTLQENPNVQITISSLHLPADETGLKIENLQLHSTLAVSAIKPKNIPYTLGPVVFAVDTDSLQKEVSFSLNSPLTSALGSSEITASGRVINPLSDPSGKAVCKLGNVPSALLDAFSGSFYPSALLGPLMNAEASLSYASGTSTIEASVKTPSFTMSHSVWTYGTGLQLEKPFALTLTPTARLVQLLFPGSQVAAAPSEPIQIKIASMSLPSLDKIDQVKISASIQSPLLNFTKMFSFTPYVVKNLSSEITVSTFDNIAVEVKSDRFSVSAAGAYKEKLALFQMSQPLKASYLVDDSLVESLMPLGERPRLAKPAFVHVEIQPGAFPLSGNILSTLNVKGAISADELLIENKVGLPQGTLQQTELVFDYEGKTSFCNIELSSKLSKEGDSLSMINGSFKASSFLVDGAINTDKLALAGDLTLENVPTSLMEILIAPEAPLTTLVGPNFSVKAHVETGPDLKEMSFSANSAYVAASADLSLKNGAISLKTAPGKLSITLTPQSYLTLDNFLTKTNSPAPFTLGQNSTFAFEIASFFVPYGIGPCIQDPNETCVKIGIKEAKIMGKLSNPALSFTDSTKQAVLVKNMQVAFQKMPGDTPILLNMSADASSTSTKLLSQSGSVAINAEISRIYTPEGNLDFSHISSKLDVNIQKLPSSVMDLFAHGLGDTSSTFSSVFGSSITAQMSLALEESTGPLKLNINSPSTRASLAGKITRGTLTLSEPIYAQVTMTSELSSFLLKGVNPLSITEIKSKNPITIEVPPTGVSIPLTGFSMQKVMIPTARIELGQISCKNEGNLNIALGLLKSVQLSQNNTLNLWFTPIDLHINQGVVDIERTDILLAETFDIALWGTINPVKNNVDMVLGLTADCLSKAFAITNIPPDYVLQIPMTGTLSDVKINTGKATAKVAALLAWQQAENAGGLAGGSTGALFGQLIGKLGALPLNDKNSPPAKRPFPWEKETSANSKELKKKDSAPKPKKTHIKKEDTPLKQLLKIIR
ncbi:MAG: hypothetical protein NTX49_08140 [Chlamydiae bacterium]|nr:hypothetical protein [Chlamydiota bacterium]